MDLKNLFEVIQTAGQKPFSYFVNSQSSGNVILSSSNYDKMSSKGFVFNQFASLESAFEKKNEIKANQSKTRYESSALDYVDGSEFDNYDTFMNYLNRPKPAFEKIKEVSASFVENVKTLINLGGLYKSDRIIVTEDQRGVFDFGLASLGLYRPIEFYSEKLDKEIKKGTIKNPFESLKLPSGVVNSDDVKKEVIGNLKIFFYTLNGKKYECERRQRNATKVFNTFPEECFLKPNTDGLMVTYYLDNKEKVFNGRGDFKLKYASSNKKSYLIYNKKDDSVKNVDIFMPVNFLTSTVKDGARAIVLLPAFLISATLEEFGIQSRISALRIGSDENTNITVSIPVKDYTESAQECFDRTFALLAQSSSADSFFAFHKIIAENEGIQAKATRNTNASFSDVSYYEQPYMNEIMQRYKNWSEENIGKDFINTKVINPNFQFALSSVGSSSLEADLDYQDILGELHKIFFLFYYYMDFLAIEMLDMREFVKSVYSRITDDVTFRKIYSLPSDKTDIKNMMRTYIVNMLVQKYKLVANGAYADTIEQKSKKENTFKEKLTSLNEELNNL
jgi:hypothetical protein